jgi:hypothetical protein
VSLALADVASAAALAIGLAACAGLRALLPILLTGLAARAGWLTLGPSFHFLTTDRALLIFGLAAALELAADKLPVVNHALDVVYTGLRPLAGSLLAAAALSSVSEPTTALVLGMVLGAPTALVPHAARSTLRLASTVFTGGLANPILSALEDLAVVLLFVVTVLLPILAALFVLSVLLIIVLVFMLGRRARATGSTVAV